MVLYVAVSFCHFVVNATSSMVIITPNVIDKSNSTIFSTPYHRDWLAIVQRKVFYASIVPIDRGNPGNG